MSWIVFAYMDHKWFSFVGFFLQHPVEIKDTNLKSHLELQVLNLSADNTNLVSCSKDLTCL